MNRGVLTPYLHARADIEHYQSGLADAENVAVMRYGGVTRVPGTLYGGETKDQGASDTTYWLPFRFNRAQIYAIKTKNLYFKF